MSDWKDAVTSVAAILGVALAAWKWLFEEMVRRQQEVPSIDGDIELEIVPTDAANVGVFINTIWNNKGSWPIDLDPRTTKFAVYEIDAAVAPVAIDQAERAARDHVHQIKDQAGDNAKAVRLLLEFHPIKDAEWFQLEPKTESRIQASVVLPKDRLYELRCLIVTADKPDENWFRKRLFSTKIQPKDASA